MKSLKIFSSLLLLLVGAGFSSVEAKAVDLPVYQNTINEIETNLNDDGELKGHIRLDNGLVFNIVDYDLRDDNAMRTWKPGDVLELDSHIKNDALVLTAKKVDNTVGQYAIPYLIFNSDASSNKHVLRIAEVNKDQNAIKLNDNTTWKFSWWNNHSSKDWVVGDRVIVQGNGDSEKYKFINLDTPVSLHHSDAKGTFFIQ